MTITAKFSNGFTDTYKGTRDVKAAWMITNKATGEVINSGHSLDRVRAQKTAEGNVKMSVRAPKPQDIANPIDMIAPAQRCRAVSIEYRKGRVADARAAGLLDDIAKGSLSGSQLWQIVQDRVWKHNKSYYAAQRALVRIEVIDL